MNIRQTAKDIVNGKRLSKHDELNFLVTGDVHELCAAVMQWICARLSTEKAVPAAKTAGFVRKVHPVIPAAQCIAFFPLRKLLRKQR